MLIKERRVKQWLMHYQMELVIVVAIVIKVLTKMTLLFVN